MRSCPDVRPDLMFLFSILTAIMSLWKIPNLKRCNVCGEGNERRFRSDASAGVSFARKCSIRPIWDCQHEQRKSYWCMAPWRGCSCRSAIFLSRSFIRNLVITTLFTIERGRCRLLLRDEWQRIEKNPKAGYILVFRDQGDVIRHSARIISAAEYIGESTIIKLNSKNGGSPLVSICTVDTVLSIYPQTHWFKGNPISKGGMKKTEKQYCRKNRLRNWHQASSSRSGLKFRHELTAEPK